MRVVSLFSRKGGVGRTVFAVNLAAILSEQGLKVALLELDPQNIISQHFDGFNEQAIGWAHTLLDPNRPADITNESYWSPRENLRVFPFGKVTAVLRKAIERNLDEQPDWLERALKSPVFDGIDVLFIDTPSGFNAYSDHAERVATSALSVWLCDAASQKAFVGSDVRVLPHGCQHRHIINQINASKSSRRELLKSWRELVGEELLPLPIHQDELVSDALLEGTAVVWFASFSQAAHDLLGLANWMRSEWLDDA